MDPFEPTSEEHAGHTTATLARAVSQVEAHLLAAALENEGIPCSVVGTDPTLAFGVTGMAPTLLLVRRTDHERASERVRALLDDAMDRASGDQQRCLVCGYELAGLLAEAPCPECGTTADTLRRLARGVQIVELDTVRGGVQLLGVLIGWLVVLALPVCAVLLLLALLGVI